MLRFLVEFGSQARAAAWSRALAREDFIKRLLIEEKYEDPRNLNRFEHRMFSQGGDDGMIRETFRRIGATNRTFVEFGAGDGLENETTALLVRGWSGLWIERDRRAVARIKRRFATLLSNGKLTVARQRVTPENIDALLGELGVSDEPDLLSIDIDGNDYWVWKSISSIHPRVVVIEYNALFPPDVKWAIAYAPRQRWRGTNYFGASLASLVDLGEDKGYKIVGCSLAGVNALFVREELVADLFQTPFTAERHWEPARYALTLPDGHARDFGEFVAG